LDPKAVVQSNYRHHHRPPSDVLAAMATDASGTEVCRAFRNNGRCRYGDECNYVHSEGDPIEPPPRGQCYNWEQKGECPYGDRCRYLHGPDDDGSRFEKKKKKKAPKKKGEAAGDGGDGGGGGDDGAAEQGGGEAKPKTRRSKARTTPVRKLDEVCQNYLEGRCRYGDQCRRKHVGDVEQKVEKLDEVCQNFLAGRCRFGDMCRRQHVVQAQEQE